MAKAKQQIQKKGAMKKGPARLPSSNEIDRLLPHDERHPQRYSKPGQKHLVIMAFIVAIILVGALLLNLLHVLPWQLSADDIAVVNGQKISLDDLNANYNTLHPQVKEQISKMQFLNETLIPQVLILQEGDKKEIVTSDEEVTFVIQDILTTQNLTAEQLQTQLQQFNLHDEQFKDMIKKRIVIAKVLNVSLPQAVVSDEEVKAFFDTNKEPIISMYGNVTFVEVQEGIKQYIITQKQQEILQQYVISLRANAKITINEDAVIN